MDYALLRARISKERPDLPLKEIDRAHAFSERAHGDERRLSGEPYMVHPVGTLHHLLSLKPDLATVQACLLHDVLEDTAVTQAEILSEFGEEVARLVEGCRTLSLVKMKEGDTRGELWRQMFLALTEDLRILMIRLCDRLHNMETLDFVPEEKRRRIAEETLGVHAVVASHLGMYELKSQLENLSFKYLEPQAFAELSGAIEVFQTEKADEFMGHAKSQLARLLKKADLPFEQIQARTKHLYSLYQKMNHKDLGDLSEVLDLFALRVIVPDLPERPDLPYEVLSLLHHHFLALDERFKDYIRLPKSNGYRSLHTTLMGVGLPLYDAPTEVQIRTRSMHEEAEIGLASHTLYKLKGRAAKTVKRRIFVLTPNRDVMALPEGATPIDFAYRIHSDVGEHLTHAKVNGMIVSLGYELHNGDLIEVLTRPSSTPKRSWLTLVKSDSARSKIRAWFTAHEETPEIETPELAAPPKIEPTAVAVVRDYSDQVEVYGIDRLPVSLSLCCLPKPPQPIIGYVTRGTHLKIHRLNCTELKKLSGERFVSASWKAKPDSSESVTSKPKTRSKALRSKPRVDRR